MSTNHSVIRLFSDSVILHSVICRSRQGFTLIELMVASVLLGMLMVVLTMIFNQSSIAWRTGVAGVAELGDTRRALGAFREVCDDILPGVGDMNVSGGAGDNRNVNYRTVSLWQENGSGLRSTGQRAYESVNWSFAPSIALSEAMNGTSKDISSAGAGQEASLFTVGVRSAGPDRKFDTEDDITTWPEDVE